MYNLHLIQKKEREKGRKKEQGSLKK